MRSKDVIGTLDQEASEVSIAVLGNTKLRIVVSGLTAFRLQSEITTHISALLELLLASHGEHEVRIVIGPAP